MAYEKGDFQTAAREWLPVAQAGSKFMQFNLGAMYLDGRVPKDAKEGERWLRLSADQRYRPAQEALGDLYLLERQSRRQDYEEALRWYRLAAGQGSAYAQGRIGFMSENGMGISRSMTVALRWYGRAADQEDFRACHSLAVMVETGRGLAADPVLAYALYELVVANNFFVAAKTSERRDKLAGAMSAEQIQTAQDLARVMGRTNRRR